MLITLTKYLLHRFSPVLSRTLSFTIEMSSLCSVFSLQKTSESYFSRVCLNFVLYVLYGAPPLIFLIILTIASCLCFFQFIKDISVDLLHFLSDILIIFSIQSFHKVLPFWTPMLVCPLEFLSSLLRRSG